MSVQTARPAVVGAQPRLAARTPTRCAASFQPTPRQLNGAQPVTTTGLQPAATPAARPAIDRDVAATASQAQRRGTPFQAAHPAADHLLPPEVEQLALFTDGPMPDEEPEHGWLTFWRYQGV